MEMVSGGLSQATKQILAELQQQNIPGPAQPGKVHFASLITDVQGVQGPQAVQMVAETQHIKAIDHAQNATQAAQIGPNKAVVAPDTAAETGLKKLLEQVAAGQNKMDSIITMATSGKVYGPQQLLSIQAAVYKFSQELELTSKVVEKGTNAVKQTMQTQV